MNQASNSSHVQSTGQRYDKICNSAAFVCGKTWVCLEKQPVGCLSVHALQVESIFPVAHNEEKVKMTSLAEIGLYEFSKAKC